MGKYKHTPSLTFVVIVYNSAPLIEATIGKVLRAINNASWSNADILVVNDGSTDDTIAVVNKMIKENEGKISLFDQDNLGRLAASMNGAKRAKGEYVSFIGGRVSLKEDSLTFLKKQLTDFPDRKVWNCDINVMRKNNIQAQFWHVVTFIAWRRYTQNPRLLSFGADDFDYYPKGTGAFVCPKALLLEGYKHIDSIYDDKKYSSDDTTLIRYIATKERIYMSPQYTADYIARSSFKDFLKHTYDRGTFLLDSYMRPGTRFFIPIILFFIIYIPLVAFVAFNPVVLLAVPALLVIVWLILIANKVKVDDAVGFCGILPLFAIIYSFGMWKGLAMYLRSRMKQA